MDSLALLHSLAYSCGCAFLRGVAFQSGIHPANWRVLCLCGMFISDTETQGGETMTTQHGGAIVDLGNVIIAHRDCVPITAQNIQTEYLARPEVDRSFYGLTKLNLKFGGNVTVVYNATDIGDELIQQWLAKHQFTQRTGISLERVHRTRGDCGEQQRDKTSYIDQSTETHRGTTIIVDDRLQVLSHFVGKVPQLFLFQPQQEEIEDERWANALEHVQIVQTWREIISAVNQ